MKLENSINQCLTHLAFKPCTGLGFALSIFSLYIYTAAYHSKHRLRDFAVIALDIFLVICFGTIIIGVYVVTNSTLWTLFAFYMAMMALGEVSNYLSMEMNIIFPAPPYK